MNLTVIGHDGHPLSAAIHDTKYQGVSADGGPLYDAVAPCVLDRSTGLTWEVKEDAPGLHDWRNTYSWFNPEEADDELDYRGLANGGDCRGSDCDTWSFVLAVNEAGRCGCGESFTV